MNVCCLLAAVREISSTFTNAFTHVCARTFYLDMCVLNEIFNFMSIHYSPFRSLCSLSSSLLSLMLLGEMPKVNFRFLPYVMAYTSLSLSLGVMLCRNEQCSMDDKERVLIDDGEIM